MYRLHRLQEGAPRCKRELLRLRQRLPQVACACMLLLLLLL
jgi:hypothetical protein